MKIIEEDKKYYVAINANEKIGPARFKKLAAYFPKMSDAWGASLGELLEAGLDETSAESLKETFKTIDPDEEAAKLEQESIKIIVKGEKAYPKLLSEIYDPPAILYVKGEILEQDQLALSVVGTRKPTYYGRQVTPRIVMGLANGGLTIVSGLARGIDTEAHRAALEAGGRTIGVLAGGLDQRSIYPPENRVLVDKITAGHGAVISEYHLGTPPLRQHFPARNRLIAGLSLATLVIEAAEKSGALLTARHALEQGREVFAVPGSIVSYASVGPNNLIKMGAKPITMAQDILDELDLRSIKLQAGMKKISADTREEAALLKVISQKPKDIDRLIKLSKLDTEVVSATLTMMEMKGKVRNVGCGNYVLKN